MYIHNQRERFALRMLIMNIQPPLNVHVIVFYQREIMRGNLFCRFDSGECLMMLLLILKYSTEIVDTWLKVGAPWWHVFDPLEFLLAVRLKKVTYFNRWKFQFFFTSYTPVPCSQNDTKMIRHWVKISSIREQKKAIKKRHSSLPMFLQDRKSNTT